jgi:hypothetical protein
LFEQTITEGTNPLRYSLYFTNSKLCRDIIASELVTKETVESVLEAATESRYEGVKQYCIEFISKYTLLQNAGFEKLPKSVQVLQLKK